MILEMFLGVILGLAVNEMCDVSSHLAQRLLRWAARRIPGAGNAERYEEEWLALLDERPGKLLKLGFASWMVIRSAFTMRSIYGRREARAQGGASLLSRSLESLNPAEFEAMTAALVHRDGFGTARRVGGPGDLGIDVIATTAGGRTIGFQCKKYGDPRRPVGASVLHQLAEHRLSGIDELVVITNGSFSPPSRRFANTHWIHTIDGEALRRWWSGAESLDDILRR
ncbi:restriction endonuclease [Streptomyces erythrochromogenes]|uniref:restriction endonuclease n=1 Tax=Streptomyces erythrochromogenes TaxID=285574 RepID=UPI00068C7FA0|nr:restriction endonuclease [Streptomyces erythrochromogenes]